MFSRSRSPRTWAVGTLVAAGLAGCAPSSDAAADEDVDVDALSDVQVGTDAAPADAAPADASELDTASDDAGADVPTSDTGPDTGETPDGAVDDVAADAGVAVNLGYPDVDLEGIAGFRLDALTYTVPGLGVERTLGVHVWYPTDDTSGEPARFNLFADEFALADAVFRAPDAPAPLLVYSHGGRGFSGQISAVARQFVRNGWVVIAPSHPPNGLFDAPAPEPFSFAAIRAFDVLAALDWVEDLPAEHPLAGHVDTSRVLTMGHSYGGQNSWILNGLAFDLDGLRARCGEGCTDADLAAFEAFAPDPRVVAGVSLDCTMDGNLLPDTGYAAVEAPMLHMSGTEGNHAAGIFERAAEADLTWVSLEGGCHESFTGTLVCPTLPLEESLTATATYTIAFGTRHVLGSTEAAVLGILDGATAVVPSASVSRTARAR